jgi:hypothetical protein
MIAKIVRVHLADNEWGNRTMARIAKETFENFPEADMVMVYEHAGWCLGFLSDGTVVSSANDAAVFHGKAKEFLLQLRSTETIAEIRRQVAPMGDALLV